VIGNVVGSFDGAEVARRDSDVIVRGMVAKVDGGVGRVYWLYFSSNCINCCP
jgi:hypothetical protein